MDSPPEPPPSPEQIIEQRLIDCGLDAAGISVRYEDLLQSIEIVIGPSAGATPEDFLCIKDASGHEIVTFKDPEMYSAFSEFQTELARPELLASLESSLREAGLWEGFPEREAFATLKAYVTALEEHAGIEAGSALAVSGNSIVFDPPRDSVNHHVDFAERYSNLLAVAFYASLRDRLGFGFIGNGMVAD